MAQAKRRGHIRSRRPKRLKKSTTFGCREEFGIPQFWGMMDGLKWKKQFGLGGFLKQFFHVLFYGLTPHEMNQNPQKKNPRWVNDTRCTFPIHEIPPKASSVMDDHDLVLVHQPWWCLGYPHDWENLRKKSNSSRWMKAMKAVARLVRWLVYRMGPPFDSVQLP